MKTSIVLSGGGVKGSWQMGTLLGLKALGKLDGVSAVYGTSVGAINAALYSMAPDQMENHWKSVKGKGDILSFNWKTLLLLSEGIYNMGPMAKKLEADCVQETGIEAVVCYTDLNTGAILYASSKDMARPEFFKYVRASGTIPFVMEPVDHRYVDGGTREQSPLKRAIDDGADKIIVVLCNPWSELMTDTWSMPGGLFKFIAAGYRAIDLLEHEVFRTDLLVCKGKNNDPAFKKLDVSIYAPDRIWMDTLEFDPSKIQAALEAGKTGAINPPLTLDQI